MRPLEKFHCRRAEWENLKYQFGASSWGGDRAAVKTFDITLCDIKREGSGNKTKGL